MSMAMCIWACVGVMIAASWIGVSVFDKMWRKNTENYYANQHALLDLIRQVHR